MYNGSDGQVTFQSQHHICNVVIAPSAPFNVTSQLSLNTALVEWDMLNGPYTGFEITPVYVQGNTEKRLVNRTKTSTVLNVTFDATQLRLDALALGAGNGPSKFKFIVKATNGNTSSPEGKTKHSLNIK